MFEVGARYGVETLFRLSSVSFMHIQPYRGSISVHVGCSKKPRIARVLLCCLAFVIGSGDCGSVLANEPKVLSLRPQIPFEDNIHREYRVEKGLPSNTINDVLQTRDGFLWAGTSNGLVRFDGQEFETFNRSNTADFPANNVERLYEDRDGTLWFGTEGGFACFRAGTIARIRALDDLRIMAIVQRRDGSICVGTEFDTWRSRDGKVFEVFSEVPGEVRELFEDADGTLWLGMRLRLLALSESGLQQFPIAQLTNDNTAWTPKSGVARILVCDDGALWIGTSQGLFEFRDGVFTLKLSGAVRDLLQTRTGGLYVHSTRFLARRVGEAFELLESSPFGDWSLAEDHEGGLWIGKGNGLGLHHYVHHPSRHRLLDRPVHCMLEGQGGQMWLGSDRGLHLWNRDKENRSVAMLNRATDATTVPLRFPRPEFAAIKTFDQTDGLPNVLVRALAREDGGHIWVGTASGLCRWTGTKLIPQSEPPALHDLNIMALHESQDGALWIGQLPWKTYRFYEGALEELTSLEGAGVRFFHEAPDGRIWAGTQQGLFREGAGHQFERIQDESFDKLLSSNFLCDYVDPDGGWWMGTRGGLVLYRDGRFHVVTPGDGLPSEYIERLHADASGDNLWMGGRHAFFSVPRADLEEFIAGTRTQVRSQRLPRSDGFISWRVGARGGPTTCLASDGRLWISDGIGTLSLPPRPAYVDLPPPQIHVDSVRVDGQVVSARQRFQLLSGPRRVAIDFSAPTFVEPLHAQAQYRLEGYDEDWIDAGSERVAYYTDLRPGDYELHVRADNGYGVWNEQHAAVAFSVNPQWFETTWFSVMCVLAVLGLVAVAVQRYTAAVHRKNVVLSESEARFRSLADSSPMLIWTSGTQNNRTYCNATWLSFTGRTLEDQLGLGWAASVHPDDRVASLTACHDAFDRRENLQVTYRLRRHDGEYRWILDFGNPRFESDGRFVGYVGSAIDITERKQARESLQESERRYEVASRVAHFGYWYRSLTDDSVYWSQEIYRIFGVDPQSFDPSLEKVLERFHPDDREHARKAHAMARSEQKPFDMEARILCPDGTEKTVHSVAEFVVCEGTGEVEAVAGILHDITQRKRAEHQAQQNREQLMRVARAASMGEITTTIAHEIKQPLFAVVSNAETAKRLLDLEVPDIAEVRDALQDIANDGNRVSSIIDHVRSLVKKEVHPSERLNLNEVSRDAARLVESELRQRGLVLDTDLASDLPFVAGNPIELHQVILNLLINGAQAMRDSKSEPRRLVLQTTADNGFVELAVKDHGPGVPDELLDRLFEPFFTTKPDGTGMGLAINRTIIAAHGGRIWATPNADRGLTVRFRLTACQDVSS